MQGLKEERKTRVPRAKFLRQRRDPATNYTLHDINDQHAKKVMSDSPGLVDFAIGLVIFVVNLPDEQVLFFGKFKLQMDCNQSC